MPLPPQKSNSPLVGDSCPPSSWVFPVGGLVATLGFDGRPTPEDMAALSEYVALIARQMGRATKPKNAGCSSHPGGSRQEGECLPCKLGWPAEDGIIDDQAHGESLLTDPALPTEGAAHGSASEKSPNTPSN